jgi:hypothetical protein
MARARAMLAASPPWGDFQQGAGSSGHRRSSSSPHSVGGHQYREVRGGVDQDPDPDRNRQDDENNHTGRHAHGRLSARLARCLHGWNLHKQPPSFGSQNARASHACHLPRKVPGFSDPFSGRHDGRDEVASRPWIRLSRQAIGRRRCQSVACWKAWPAAHRRSSLRCLPTSCSEIGTLVLEKPAGSTIVGLPARSNGAV